MSAEPRKHHLEDNALAAKLQSAWSASLSNSPAATLVWGGIFLVLLLSLAWRYYTMHTTGQASIAWKALAVAPDVEAYKQIARDHPDTRAGQVARLQAARLQLQTALG